MSGETIETLLIFLAVAAALALAVRRFAGGRYGRLRSSGQVTTDYESFLVNPDLRYYLSGPDSCPDAIIGIAKAWVLDSDLWKPRDLESKSMREIVAGMQARAGQSLSSLHGFVLLDHQGNQIGNWFSPPGPNVTVRITGERKVVISTPLAEIRPAP